MTETGLARPCRFTCYSCPARRGAAGLRYRPSGAAPGDRQQGHFPFDEVMKRNATARGLKLCRWSCSNCSAGWKTGKSACHPVRLHGQGPLGGNAARPEDRGLRPQGISGRMSTAPHGDEVNLIFRGQDYGWPLAVLIIRGAQLGSPAGCQGRTYQFIIGYLYPSHPRGSHSKPNSAERCWSASLRQVTVFSTRSTSSRVSSAALAMCASTQAAKS
jgi:hypothetical protein